MRTQCYSGAAFRNTVNSGGTEYVEFSGLSYENAIFGTQIVSSALAENDTVGGGGKMVIDDGGYASRTFGYRPE
jgi:hypothetical protein